MTNVADAAPVPGQVQPPARTSIRGLLAQTEIDLRLFGMLVALGAILLTFNILSGGKFFQPTNMITLAVQATGVAIIATGMVLVIVSRNIDLSVGSLVGLIAMTYALLMTDWMPDVLGIGADFPFRWLIALGIGVAMGAAIGGAPGLHHRLHRRAVVHRHPRRAALDPRRGLVPLERRRGVGTGPQLPAHRRRGAGFDRRHPDLGARPRRLSSRSSSCSSTVAGNAGATASRVRPMWAEVLIGVVGSVAVLGVAAFANANLWPEGLAESDRPRAELGAGTRRRLEDPDRVSRTRSSCSSA